VHRLYNFLYVHSAFPLYKLLSALRGTTIRSIGHISRLQNVKDNDEVFTERRVWFLFETLQHT
jgi:hypothetical protein